VANEVERESPSLGRFREYLRVLARLQIDSQLQGKLDLSDIVRRIAAAGGAEKGIRTWPT
jgi:hypothetical protein